MDSKPYLDKIITSPHLPKLPGQRGYSSVKTFPDISHTYLHSKFESDNSVPATSADGKITIAFKTKAFYTLKPIHKGLAELDAAENVCRIEHRQYLDKMLVDMEESRKSKYDRRMKYWRSSKEKIGFGDTFNAYDEPQSPDEMEGTRPFGDIVRGDEDVADPSDRGRAGVGRAADIAEQEEVVAAHSTDDYHGDEDFENDDDFEDDEGAGVGNANAIPPQTVAQSNSGGPEVATRPGTSSREISPPAAQGPGPISTSARTLQGSAGRSGSGKARPRAPNGGGGVTGTLGRSNTGASANSAGSYGFGGSKSIASSAGSMGGSSTFTGFTGYTGENIPKSKKMHSRMGVFNTLMDNIEPPKSPTKRFGVIQSRKSGRIK